MNPKTTFLNFEGRFGALLTQVQTAGNNTCIWCIIYGQNNHKGHSDWDNYWENTTPGVGCVPARPAVIYT
jgi:hypothetical protein